ncbi:MAG TPA: hypothetical protein VF039_10785, partial [Longimicrobiales bacterium]
MKSVSRLALLAAGLLAAAPLSAQEREGRWDNTISFSPILALFEVVIADYERRVADEATIGLGLGYIPFDEASDDGEDDGEGSYTALDFKARFYPDRAFKGWEFGASLGFARVAYHDDVTGEEADARGLSDGVEVGHGWLLGDTERFFVGTAIGAKRFWFDDENDDIPTVMPTGRLSVGIAF